MGGLVTQEELELGGQARNTSNFVVNDPNNGIGILEALAKASQSGGVSGPSLREKLRAPLPKEAIKPHPAKKFLSTVNVAYIIERLNDVFGEDGWEANYTIIESEQMIVARCDFSAGKIKRTAFGGNKNDDRGDSYKGACTDALSKAVSQIGIAQDVYKGIHDKELAGDGKQIQVSNGQATVTANKAVAGTPQQSTITKKTTTKPAVQKADKQTDFPHGANQGNLPLPENNLPAKTFVASDSDIPDNIGSPKPSKDEMDSFGKRFKDLKMDMNKIGDFLRKRFDVKQPSKELNTEQWKLALAELESANETGKLKELLG